MAARIRNRLDKPREHAAGGAGLPIGPIVPLLGRYDPRDLPPVRALPFTGTAGI